MENYQNMIGCIYIMKILQVNMVNFIEVSEMLHGTKSKKINLIKLLAQEVLKVYTN